MSELVVKQDGIYKDGIKQPLVFGDAEQIKALRNYENKMAMLQQEGEPLDVDYETREIVASATYKCPCGTRVYFEVNVEEEGGVEEFAGETRTCRGCKKEYILEVNEDDEVVCKLNIE